MGKVLVPTPFITRQRSFYVIKKFMQDENDGLGFWNNKVRIICIFWVQCENRGKYQVGMLFSVVAFSRVVMMGIVYFAMSSFFGGIVGDVERVWRIV